MDWDATATALGVALPPGHVALVDEWGAGTFDDFLVAYAPGHPNRHLDLAAQAEGRLSALRTLADGGERLRSSRGVVAGGLLPCNLLMDAC